MQMADYDLLNVLDVVPSRLDSGRQLMLLVVGGPGKDIGDRSAPLDVDILRTACLEQDQSGSWMVNQASNECEITAFVGGVGVRLGAAVNAAEEPERMSSCNGSSYDSQGIFSPSFVDIKDPEVKNAHLRAWWTFEGWNGRRSELVGKRGHDGCNDVVT